LPWKQGWNRNKPIVSIFTGQQWFRIRKL